ncbi:unnamed protein product, partial [Hymenolepis diminuta]
TFASLIYLNRSFNSIAQQALNIADINSPRYAEERRKIFQNFMYHLTSFHSLLNYLGVSYIQIPICDRNF